MYLKSFCRRGVLLFTSLLLCGCTATGNQQAAKNISGFDRSATAEASQEAIEDGVVDCKIHVMEPEAVAGNGGVVGPESRALSDASGKENQLKVDGALDFCASAQESWQKGDLDGALQNLDQAYALILSFDTEDDPKLIQQKDDIRFMISKRALEIYASRNIVVTGTHKAIPVTLNKYVNSEIKRFTGPEKRFFISSLKRSGRYRPMIVKALKEAGLPEELSWLPLIESGYKVRALSPARALGMWQFIPSTGYKFGLKRDVYVDERLDPIKSTNAAINYLSELHGMFGDWATVLAAYNCGEGRVLRTIRRQNINYLDNFWDLYGKLPRETSRYVPRFLAVLHVINNAEKYGIDLDDVDPPLAYETVTVSRQVYLKDIGAKINVSAKELRTLNPELRYKVLPNGEYALNVPIGKSQHLLAKINEIAVHKAPVNAFVYHRVRTGETLSTIATKYHSSMRKIARANNIRKYNKIGAGKLLKIPQGSRAVVSAKRKKTSRQSVSKHYVKQGDSLWNIARRYGTTTKDIQRLNHMASADLSVGQVLKISSGGSSASSSVKGSVYKVRRGDSLFIIAKKYKMKLNRLLSLNRLTSGSTIYPGQKLRVE